MWNKVDTACFEILTRCPLACVHCSACANPQRTDIVTLRQFTQALERLGRLREVYLSGGEPFEHPDLVGFIGVAQQRADRVVIYSSGVVGSGGEPAPVAPELLREVARAGVHRIDVSLYADSPEEHDRVTATPGSWSAVIESLQRMKAADLDVGIHHVPVLPQADILKGVARLAEQLQVRRLHLLAVATQGRGARLRASMLSDAWFNEARALSAGHTSVDVVMSSRIRQQAGLKEPSERDSLVATFIDYRGCMYPGEGNRQWSMRSTSSLFDTSTGVPLN